MLKENDSLRTISHVSDIELDRFHMYPIVIRKLLKKCLRSFVLISFELFPITLVGRLLSITCERVNAKLRMP